MIYVSALYIKIKPVFTYIIAILLIVVGIRGVFVPKDLDKYNKVGYFQVRPYKYGLYLTQKDTGIFYNLSPFNDYLLPHNTSLLNYSETQTIANESVRKTDFISSYGTAFDTVMSYLGLYTPTATFETQEEKVTYKYNNQSNKLTFSITSNTDYQNLVRTLSINESDIIYDNNGVLYSNTDPETVSLLNTVYKKTIETKVTDWNEKQTNPMYLYVYNPHTNGQIEIPVDTNSFKISDVNTALLRIEFQMLNSQDSTIYFEVKESI